MWARLAVPLLVLLSLASSQPVIPRSCTYSADPIDTVIYDSQGKSYPVVLTNGMLSTPDGVAYSASFTFLVRVGETRSILGYLGIGASPSASSVLYVNVTGTLGCAMQKLLLVSVDSCYQYGPAPVPDICHWALQYVGGVYQYSVSREASGEIAIIVPKWLNANSPFTLLSTSDDCDAFYNCSLSVTNILNTFLEGGFSNVSNSNVYVTNDTVIDVDGPSTTFEGGTYITINNYNATALNITLYNSTDTQVNAEPGEVTVNIYSLNSTACSYSADWRAFTPESNRTVNTSPTPMLFDPGSLVTAGDWELDTASTLKYVGVISPQKFYFSVCLVQAGVYLSNATLPGQRIIMSLYNVTDTPFKVSPTGDAYTEVLEATTELQLVASTCLSIAGVEVYTGDVFGIYLWAPVAALQLRQLSAFSVSVLPDGCASGSPSTNTTVNVTIKVEVKLPNGSQVLPGECIEIDANDTTGDFYINNPGVCGVVVEQGPIDAAHAGESWLRHAWHRVRDYVLGATSTLTGTLYFVDTANIEPRYTGDNQIYWDFKCPINCGEEPINTNSTCNCEDGVETEGTCNCEGGVDTEGSCSCGESVETPGTCNCGESVETPQIDTPDGEPLKIEDGVETPEIHTPDGNPLEVPDGVETPTVEGPGGLPVSFPTGISPGPPVPITIALNPSGVGGKGPCEKGGGLLDPKEPIVGIMPDGRRVKLIGSVLSSGASLASSGVSAATSAATGAAGVVAEVVTGVLGCNGGGPPLPSPSLTGLSTPGLPGVPGSNLHASLAAAISALTGVPGGPPPSADANAAESVSSATSSTGYLLPSAIVPTEITIWAGGLQIPTANESIVMMECSELYRGYVLIIKGPPDETLVCLERDDGWDFYPIPFGEAFYEEVFSGNGTGLVAGRYLEMHVYPNNTLFEIRDADIVMPGNCSNCNLQVSSTGKILGFSSGTSVITGNQTVWETAIIRASDSALIMDDNSTFINAGPTVLGGTTITELNVTTINVATLNVDGSGVVWSDQAFSTAPELVTLTDQSGNSCGATIATTTASCSRVYNIVSCFMQIGTFAAGPSVDDCEVYCFTFQEFDTYPQWKPAGAAEWQYIGRSPIIVSGSGDENAPPNLKHSDTGESQAANLWWNNVGDGRFCIARDDISNLGAAPTQPFAEAQYTWRSQWD
jgi:hypothetical protein